MTLKMRGFALLCTCLLLAGMATPALSETAPQDPYTAYLMEYARSFPLADDLPELAALRTYDTFLIGEYHGM